MTSRSGPLSDRALDASGNQDIATASAVMHTGELLDELAPGPLRASLEGLAMTLPELFGTLDSACLDRLSERLGDEPTGQSFSEVLFLSEHHLHVVQSLANRPGVALLAASPAPGSVGLVLSHMHSVAKRGSP